MHTKILIAIFALTTLSSTHAQSSGNQDIQSLYLDGHYQVFPSEYGETSELDITVQEVGIQAECRTSRELSRLERLFSFSSDGMKHKHNSYYTTGEIVDYDSSTGRLDMQLKAIKKGKKATTCSHYIKVAFSYTNPYSQQKVEAFTKLIFDNSKSATTSKVKLFQRDASTLTFKCRSAYKKPGELEFYRDGVQNCGGRP